MKWFRLVVERWRAEYWHVCWIARTPTGMAHGDGTYTIPSGLRVESIADLRKKLAEDTGCESSKINITSLTRIRK